MMYIYITNPLHNEFLYNESSKEPQHDETSARRIRYITKLYITNVYIPNPPYEEPLYNEYSTWEILHNKILWRILHTTNLYITNPLRSHYLYNDVPTFRHKEKGFPHNEFRNKYIL